ncbi:hypothetical protein LINGRAHAP2_LOCUS6817 [Linum grandiflorum]
MSSFPDEGWQSDVHSSVKSMYSVNEMKKAKLFEMWNSSKAHEDDDDELMMKSKCCYSFCILVDSSSAGY